MCTILKSLYFKYFTHCPSFNTYPTSQELDKYGAYSYLEHFPFFNEYPSSHDKGLENIFIAPPIIKTIHEKQKKHIINFLFI
jgi:hypothetical protein